jgi:hypothetical protein
MGHFASDANRARQTELRRRADAARLAATALARKEEPPPKRTRGRARLLQTLRPSSRAA